jgi:hypothetical protein
MMCRYGSRILMDFDARSSTHLSAGILDPEDLAVLDRFIFRFVVEHESKNAEIDEVFPMNPSEAPHQDQPQSKISGGKGGMLSTGTLPIVAAGDDGVTALVPDFHGTLIIGVADRLETKRADLGDIASIR